MSNIKVIYVSTNGYVEYLYDFLNSMYNFFPGKEKELYIYSNNLDRCNEIIKTCDYNNELIHVNIIKIFDLLYPTFNINKCKIINQIVEEFDDNDYVFYFDADTIFKDNKMYDKWDELISLMDDGFVLLTKHPFYVGEDDENFYGTPIRWCENNLYTENLTEKEEFSSAFIPATKYTYINSSFYAGCKKSIIMFGCVINDLESYDLSRKFWPDHKMSYHVPQYMDENYFNKVYYEYENGNTNCLKLKAESFSQLYGIKSKNSDTIFMYQKNIDINKKTCRR